MIPNNAPINGMQASPDSLNIGMQGLSVGRSKPKRAARKFHQDVGLTFASQTPTPTPSYSEYDVSQVTNSSVELGNKSNMGKFQNTGDIKLSEYRYQEQLKYNDTNGEPSDTFLTFENAAPPASGTRYLTMDQGTASPKFIRSSMYFVPESESLRKATKLPMSVTIRPFASLEESEDTVPEVDMSHLGNSSEFMDVGPPRCHRCRAYINPLAQFTNMVTFTCNICQFPKNTVPPEYQSYLDSQGYRVDKLSRPELSKGVYDIVLPKEYNFGGPEVTPSALHHIFLIDISERSVKQNLPVIMADAIRATLYQPGNDGTSEDIEKNGGRKFAIMMFDKRVHYFNLSPSIESVQITISPDLEDPFVPFNEGLFAEPETSKLVIEDTLNYLEQMTFHEGLVLDAEPSYAAACRAAMLALASVGGGKITSVLSALPSWGPGRLIFKDHKAVGRAGNPEIERGSLLPDNDYYKLLAKDFVANNVGLDCMVVCPTSVDLSNIGWLCAASGGTTRRWQSFETQRDSRSFVSSIVNSVDKVRAYQTQLKLRCSTGLQVTQYFGAYAVNNLSIVGGSNDPNIPVLSEDNSITVLLNYDGKLDTKYDCHFQAAVLYTSPTGVRKVRVMNLVLAVAERLEDVFNLVDEDSVVTTIIRDSLSFIGKQPMIELRESVNEKLVDIFTQYRAMSEFNHNSQRSLSNQLLFPEKLRHLPLFMLAFIKSRAIRSSTVSSDSRLVDIYQLLNSPIDKVTYSLCPALVELHSLTEDEALYDVSKSFLKVPKFKDLSTKEMDYGAYILCDGFAVYFIIHPNSNILLIKDLFGEQFESVEEIDPSMDSLPKLDTLISLQARNLINYLHKHIVGTERIGLDSIRIIRQEIDSSGILQEKLVEDSLRGDIVSVNWPSYADYITNLHKAIMVKLENDKSSSKVKQSIASVDNSDTLAQRIIHF